MAGANNARQKMINLMYLVFIAMLAMQIDQEILRNFLDINNSLENSKELTEGNSELFYANLEQKAKNAEAKFGALNAEAQIVREKSGKLVGHIQGIKDQLTEAAHFDENSEYSVLKSTDEVKALFFPKDKETELSTGLVQEIEGYKTYITSTFGKEGMKAQFGSVLSRVESTLDLSEKTVADKKQRWSLRKFGGETPLVAALSTLTQIQSDIRAIESETVTKMLAKKIDAEISVNAFKAIVNAPSAMFTDTKATATIALGSYDSTADIRVNVNGKNISVQNGQAQLPLTGGVGKHSIKGTISLKNIGTGKYDSFPFEHKYEVFAKSSGGGVIAAKKMKVFYIGVDNPVEGTLTGSKPGTLAMRASSGSLKKKGKDWSIRPSGGREVTLTLTGKMNDGTSGSVAETFRIKAIPKPVGEMQGSNSPKMPVSSLVKQTLRADIPDFDFDVNPTVTSFIMKVAGRPSIRVSGNKLTGAAKAAVARLRSGDLVVFNNIKATASGIKLKEVSPVTVEIQ